jgi:hypothetical protein
MKIDIIGADKVGATIATLLESCRFCSRVVHADLRATVNLRSLKNSSLHRGHGGSIREYGGSETRLDS